MININPNDGHSAGWSNPIDCAKQDDSADYFDCSGSQGGQNVYNNFWLQDAGWGSPDNAMTADFKDIDMMKADMKYLTIARHNNGVCEAYASYNLLKHEDLYTLFYDGYTTITGNRVYHGGPNMDKDPFFFDGAESGQIQLNYNWGDNG